MQVDAAGFTLAPLQPQYRSGGSNVSHSCMVTFVLKVDLGGFLSEKSSFGLLLPWSHQIAEGFLHSMLTSIMALRDTVSPKRSILSHSVGTVFIALTRVALNHLFGLLSPFAWRSWDVAADLQSHIFVNLSSAGFLIEGTDASLS